VSNLVARNPDWLVGTFNAWLEGNAVATPGGHIVNILRVDNHPGYETAAIVEISDDGATADFGPQTGFIRFPAAPRSSPSGAIQRRISTGR